MSKANCSLPSFIAPSVMGPDEIRLAVVVSVTWSAANTPSTYTLSRSADTSRMADTLCHFPSFMATELVTETVVEPSNSSNRGFPLTSRNVQPRSPGVPPTITPACSVVRSTTSTVKLCRAPNCKAWVATGVRSTRSDPAVNRRARLPPGPATYVGASSGALASGIARLSQGLKS